MKVLVCRHVPHEGLGYFERLFQEAGIDFEYQDLYHDSEPRRLAAYQGLIIMGGPMNVYQEKEYPFLKTDLQYIEEGLKSDLPMLGFCLGAQLFSRALGGKVRKNNLPELGWYQLKLENKSSDSLLDGFPEQFYVFQWHEDTFEIPPGGVLLASSERCVNQAFSWGKNVFGIQFHLEVDEAIIHNWLKDEATASEWGFSVEPILQETRVRVGEALNLGKRLFQNFSQKLCKMN